jgi:AraC-like DNA-binding protein
LLRELLIAIIGLYTLSEGATQLFPGKNSSWTTFNDSADNGKSRTISLTVADSVTWIYQLDTGYQWPYAGLVMETEQTDKTRSKLSTDEDATLIVFMKSNYNGRLVVQIASFDPEITKNTDPVSMRVAEYSLSVSREISRAAIPFGKFRVAEWWKKKYDIAPEDNRLYLDSICTIEWVFSDAERIGKTDTLIICGVSVVRGEKTGAFLMVFLLLAAVGMIVLFYDKLKNRNKLSPDSPVSPEKKMEPKPIDTGPDEWARVIAFLQENYYNPDISLSTVASATGLSETKLSKIVKERHNNGFRSLIHDFRTEEAKRLLVRTELNVAEIAYKLGYATPNHFNREFKLRIGVTPTQYRIKNNEKN